jgi:hypothetical protein
MLGIAGLIGGDWQSEGCIQQICLLTKIGKPSTLKATSKSTAEYMIYRDRRSLFSGLARRKPVQSHSNSMASHKILRKWLSDCLEQHKWCRTTTVQGPVFSPYRLIHISTSNTCLSVDHLPHTAYLALSYCWGAATIFSTTKENLEDHMKSIAWEKLPNTFQQAIELTQILGYEYIWIDSLCIIQHDNQDFAIQSREMGDIYANAAVVISADLAKNVYEGFLQQREHMPITIRVPRSKISRFEVSLSLSKAQCTQPDQSTNKQNNLCEDVEIVFARPDMSRTKMARNYMASIDHDSFARAPTGARAW